MSTLQKIQDWYFSQCDCEWEHQRGVTIGTIDNPGWSVTIDLVGTNLETAAFTPVARGVEKDGSTPGLDWLTCSVAGGQFKAFGGPHKLDEMLCIFLEWAEGIR